MTLKEIFYDTSNELFLLQDGKRRYPILTPLGLPRLCRLHVNGIPLRSSPGQEGLLERVVKQQFCGIPRSPRFEYSYSVDRDLLDGVSADHNYHDQTLIIPVAFYKIEGYKDEVPYIFYSLPVPSINYGRS